MRKGFRLVGMRLRVRSVGLSVSTCDVSCSPILESRLRRDADRFFPDAFIRDELSKGRYDPAITGICFEMLLELFGRMLKSDLGPKEGAELKIENVC